MKEKRTRRTRAGMTGSMINAVINQILIEMEYGLKNSEHVTGKSWEKLFGTKDSIVVHVQKTIAALNELKQLEAAKTMLNTSDQEGAPLTNEEMALLTEWLAEKDKKDV